MVDRYNQITGQGQFESTSDGDSIDCCDNGFVQIKKFGESGKTSPSVVRVGRFSFRCSLQVPARREKLFTGSCDYGHEQIFVVTEAYEHLSQSLARCGINRVRLGSIKGDFNYVTVKEVAALAAGNVTGRVQR